jgi:hypothetical protein
MPALPGRAALIAGAALASLAACSAKDNGTLLAVRVDTDLSVPGQIDGIAIDVHPDRGVDSTDTFKVADNAHLPVTLGLRPRGDPSFGVEVTARGLLGTTTVVAQKARVQFVSGQAREFTMLLSSDCVPAGVCAGSNVCVKGPRCVAETSVAQLRAYVPGPPSRDGGAGGSGADAPVDTGPGGAGGGGGNAPVDAGGPEARPNPGTWVPVPGVPATVTLSAVWPFGAGDVWVAGAQAAGVVFHYDGTMWMPSAVPAGTPALYGLWGSAPGDLWAVGTGGTVLHLSNGTWQAMKAPGSPTLTAIWGAAANDIWIVGSGGKIFHTDGVMGPVQEATSVTTGLFAVGGSVLPGGTADVWAVGASGTILHRTSTGWGSEAQGLTQSILYAVWSDGPSDVWVAGDKTVLRLSGGAWKPEAGAVDVALAIWGSAGDDIWTVGRATQPTGDSIARWDGVAFTGLADAKGSTLQAVHGVSSANVWTAGVGGAVFRFQGL